MPNQLRAGSRRVILGVLAISLAASASTSLAAPNPGGHRQHDVFGGYSSKQIVVKLRPEAMKTPAAKRHFRGALRDADPRPALSNQVQATAGNWRATRMRPAYSEPFADPALAAKHGLDRTFVIEVPDGTDTEAMAAAFAELDGDIEVAAIDGIGGVADVFPNDAYFGVQYSLNNTAQKVGSCVGGSLAGDPCSTNAQCQGGTCSGQNGTSDADIDAPAAWALHTGDLGTVTIAIIDSGVDPHSDFGSRLVPGRNTNNPLTPNDTSDDCAPQGHGTHVAGIAAASGNNGIGVAGVTWGAYIMPVRVLNGCSGTTSQLAAGIRWAADNGADVANFSLQYYFNNDLAQYTLLNDAVNYAHDLGMILIGATGNNNQGGAGVVAYPARLLNCMGVSGTTSADLFADFTTTSPQWSSNYGNEVDVCAPGDDILSTLSGDYVYRVGTSMATPHVSGLAALIKSYRPALTNVDIEMILVQTAEDRGPAGWDDHYGFGRINAHRALIAAQTWPIVMISSTPPDGAIDARKPIDANGMNAYGWQSLAMTFTVNASGVMSDDFLVTQEGGVAQAPPVVNVAPLTVESAEITLERVIEVFAWTTITHDAGGASIRLGFLPGDVNADGVSNLDDVATLADTLNGASEPLPIWSMDMDRSDTATAADLLELADLLNGAEEYDPYLDEVLP